MSEFTLNHLRVLEAESIYILREVVAECGRPVMLYSIGKDSSVMVRLAQKAFYPAPFPFPLLHIDTTYKFREMIEFRDRVCSEIGARLIVHTNRQAIEAGANPLQLGTQKCCSLLKTRALLDALGEGGFDAAFRGARRDEERSRAKERVYSFRDAFGQWDPKNQRPEFWNLFNGRINKGETIRVFPLSNWTELDVWRYIHLENIPVVSLYFAKMRSMVVRGCFLIPVEEPFALLPGERAEMVMCRMRSLGCSPCTGAIRSTAGTVPEIIDEMTRVRRSERESRLIDHDQDGSMEIQKAGGIFLVSLEIEAFLRQSEEIHLLRFSTAGSVDDGKSTLIGRLLVDSKAVYEDQLASAGRAAAFRPASGMDFALLTDGLRAEREQGITIDVAYRYFSNPRRKFIVADVPGHEQYTRNMATGTSTVNLAVILVDARKGVLSQTRRHAFIASLLGVPHMVVAVNKMDLVGYSEAVFDQIRADFNQFAAWLEVGDLQFIPISAWLGDNVVAKSAHMPWYEGPSLLHHLETVHIARDDNVTEMRFPIQYVIRAGQDFRGYAGQVASGIVRVGDAVMVVPSGSTSRVRSIVARDGELPMAFTPMAVTLCLEEEVDISRGDMLVHPQHAPHIGRQLDARVVWMSSRPLLIGREFLVKHTTQQVRACATAVRYRIDTDSLEKQRASDLGMNEIGAVIFETSRPLFYDPYRRNHAIGGFILIDPANNETVAAGMITGRWPRNEGVFLDGLKFENSRITTADRERRSGHRAATVWLAGNQEAAYLLELELFRRGCLVHALVETGSRRAFTDLANLLNTVGLITIYAGPPLDLAERDVLRGRFGADQFVYVDASCSGVTPQDMAAAACRSLEEGGFLRA